MRIWFIQSLKIGAILAFISAFIWLTVGGCIVGYRMHWKGCCEKIVGTVVAYEPGSQQTSQGEATQSLYAVFQFELPHTNESKTGRSSVATYPPSYAIGENVNVLVHPDTPNEAKIDAYGELYILPTVFLCVGMWMLAAGLIFLFFFHKLSHNEGYRV